MTDKRHVVEADIDLAPGDLAYTKVGKNGVNRVVYAVGFEAIESTQNKHSLTRLWPPFHLPQYMTLATTPIPNAQDGRHISSLLGWASRKHYPFPS